MLLKPTKIRSYLAAMKARGFSSQAVLAGTGLKELQLKDPALLVEARQRERVILNMLRLTGNPALGLEIGASAQLVDFGVLAYAQMSSRSMREALSLWVRYSNAVGTTMRIRLDEQGPRDWGVVYEIGKLETAVERFSAEEMVAMAASLGPALGGPAFVIGECTFAYAPPPHSARYEAVLGCKVRFNAAQTSMRPSAPKLDWTLPGSDPEFHAVCLRHLDQLQRQISHEHDMSGRLRNLLLSRPEAPHSLAEAASYLGVSPRSLRRYLQQEQTHYQALVDQVRLDLATDYLRAEKSSIKEVGFALGYRSVNAFRRAFKAWTGRTIKAFLAEESTKRPLP